MNISEQTILSYRGPYSSPLHLPDRAYLDGIPADFMPYAFLLYDGTIGSQQADRGQSAQPEECYVVSLVGSSSAAAGFALQIYDTERKRLLEDSPVFSGNRVGTALRQFWLKRPYRLPANAQIQTRVTNLAVVDNQIQVVAWGLRR